jgi:hypothetical protein
LKYTLKVQKILEGMQAFLTAQAADHKINLKTKIMNFNISKIAGKSSKKN